MSRSTLANRTGVRGLFSGFLIFDLRRTGNHGKKCLNCSLGSKCAAKTDRSNTRPHDRLTLPQRNTPARPRAFYPIGPVSAAPCPHVARSHFSRTGRRSECYVLPEPRCAALHRRPASYRSMNPPEVACPPSGHTPSLPSRPECSPHDARPGTGSSRAEYAGPSSRSRRAPRDGRRLHGGEGRLRVATLDGGLELSTGVLRPVPFRAVQAYGRNSSGARTVPGPFAPPAGPRTVHLVLQPPLALGSGCL